MKKFYNLGPWCLLIMELDFRFIFLFYILSGRVGVGAGGFNKYHEYIQSMNLV